MDTVYIQGRKKEEYVEIAIFKSFIRKAKLSLLISEKWILCLPLAAKEAGKSGERIVMIDMTPKQIKV